MLRCWALALNWVHTFNSAIGNNLFISLSWGEKTQSITCCSFAHEKKDSNNNNNERSRISPRHRYNIVCYFIGLHPTCFVIHKYNCSFRPLSASYRAFLFRYFLECAPAEMYTHTHIARVNLRILIFPNTRNAKTKRRRRKQNQQQQTRKMLRE